MFCKKCILLKQTWMFHNEPGTIVSFDRILRSKITIVLFSHHKYELANLDPSNFSFFFKYSTIEFMNQLYYENLLLVGAVQPFCLSH